MKKGKLIISNLIIVFLTLNFLAGCKDSFLEQNPKGELTENQIADQKGVEFLLVGAYGLLNGGAGGTWGHYGSAPSQWIWGELTADDLHKGSEPNDQPTLLDVERYSMNAANEHAEALWQNYYEGINRCNQTLKTLKEVQDGEEPFSDERAIEIEAESRFLRGHYYFMLWRVFKNIPYIDEAMSSEEVADAVNDVDVFPFIIDDFEFAFENLPEQKPLGDAGRVNKVAAQAYLGKLYLYEERYDEALSLFKKVIEALPDLKDLKFEDNFDINTENGPEAIFSVQHAINPDGSGDNANIGDMLGGLYGTAPVSCCGFQQPSIDLVNSFRVDGDGLPMLDFSYRDDPFLSDLGLSSQEKRNYEVDNSYSFDPRLDYTVGRRGVPFHDWGPMAGDAWIRDPASAGPFVGYKHLIDRADFDGNVSSTENYVTGLDVNIVRLADVYLMAAECAISGSELDLQYALDRVNDIRIRASHLPHKKLANGSDAANYDVKPYSNFPDKNYAMNAIQFERRLELALEGDRFFDLVRWGIADEILNGYFSFESEYLSTYKGTSFDDSKILAPIPQNEIDRSNGTLIQNPGY